MSQPSLGYQNLYQLITRIHPFFCALSGSFSMVLSPPVAPNMPIDNSAMFISPTGVRYSVLDRGAEWLV